MSIPSAGSGAANLPQQNILDLFLAGVRAADPYLAVQSCLHADNAQLHIDLGRESDQHQRSSAWPLVHVLAFGKAACAMAEAARSIIPPSKMAQPGLIVTTYDNVRAIENFQVIGAGHPLPDAAGLQAAQLLANRAAAARPGELLLVLVSGGGSALLPLPVVGISLPEKIATTNLLLACGANIQQINCVRKHLSQLKGGGLAKLAGCADLHALILSDVIGDDLSAIASGGFRSCRLKCASGRHELDIQFSGVGHRLNFQRSCVCHRIGFKWAGFRNRLDFKYSGIRYRIGFKYIKRGKFFGYGCGHGGSWRIQSAFFFGLYEHRSCEPL